MSDFESFSPGSASESYDPAAFERFKEQIKKNAAFMAAARKGEQKQKVKEDRLAKILLKFIQSNQKSGILLLAAKLLEENISASFILSIIILGNEDLKKETELSLPQAEGAVEAKPAVRQSASADSIPSEFSLMTKFENHALPLTLKAAIDKWGRGIFEAGSAAPFRVLETALNKEGNIKNVVVDCTANVLGDFMETSNARPIPAYETLYSFCEFLMKGVMKQLQKQIENQKELN